MMETKTIHEVRLPRLSETDEESLITFWHKTEGDAVRKGEVVVEVQTEKAVSEIESDTDGVIVKIHKKRGEVIGAGEPLASIALEAGRTVPPAPELSRVIASPSVRKLAREMGVKLEDLQESKKGKIQKEDVLKFAEKLEKKRNPHTVAADGNEAGAVGEIEIVKLGGIRKAIAKAMAHSKRTVPHVTHFGQADISTLAAHRDRVKETAGARDIKLTFLPYVVKALISALKEYKELNASIDETEENILYKKFYHIGIAVQTDNGLVVPVIRNADQKTVPELAKEIALLTTLARENRLTMEQIKEGTCTVSNIGSAGGQWFTPVINHPETSILGFGEMMEKPVVRNGEIAIGKMLPLSLSYDHRVIDGVIAQKALNRIKKLLEDPELLLLELL